MAQNVRTPCLAAAALFVLLALLIARLAVAPLGAADLLGIAACAAAAGAFATLACVLGPRPGNAEHQLGLSKSHPATPDVSALAKEVAAQVEARLYASRVTTVSAAELRPSPDDSRSPLSTDQISASTAAKPRLGRGLSALIHNPAAIAKPTADAPAAAPDASPRGDDERAAA